MLCLPAPVVQDESTAVLSGPYLHGAAVPSWGSLAVAHRKAADDHVRLLQSPGGAFGAGEPQVSAGWGRERA